MILYRRDTREIIELDDALLVARGGEGAIYRIPSAPDLVAKVYHQMLPGRQRKLEAMIANRPADPNGHGHRALAWPEDVLVDDGSLVRGFAMQFFSGHRIMDAYNPGERKERFKGFTPASLHRVARNLAAAFESVHACGHVVGDVNESNVLVDAKGLISFVDTDSFQIHDATTGRSYRCGVGKHEYTPRELIGQPLAEIDRNPTADHFGLAVLVYQLLMLGTHPFAGKFMGADEVSSPVERIERGFFAHGAGSPLLPRHSLTLVHEQLERLFIRCFVDGHADPAARPTASEWREALEEAERDLLTCDVNRSHRYASRHDVCPWCDIKLKSKLDYFPPPPSKGTVSATATLTPLPRKVEVVPKVVVAPAIVATPRVPPAWPSARQTPFERAISFARYAFAEHPITTLLAVGLSAVIGGRALIVRESTPERKDVGEWCATDSSCKSDICVDGTCSSTRRVPMPSASPTSGPQPAVTATTTATATASAAPSAACPLGTWDGRVRGWARYFQAECNIAGAEAGHFVGVTTDSTEAYSMPQIASAWKSYMSQPGNALCGKTRIVVLVEPTTAKVIAGIFLEAERPQSAAESRLPGVADWERFIEHRTDGLLKTNAGEPVRHVLCFFPVERAAPGWPSSP